MIAGAEADLHGSPSAGDEANAMSKQFWAAATLPTASLMPRPVNWLTVGPEASWRRATIGDQRDMGHGSGGAQRKLPTWIPCSGATALVEAWCQSIGGDRIAVASGNIHDTWAALSLCRAVGPAGT